MPPVLAALVLAACGSTERGIPQSDADTLREELGDVASFVERGDCDEVDGQLRQVRDAVVDLPSSVDDQLVANLNEGVTTLEGAVAEDCQEQTDQQQQEQEPPPQQEPSTTEQPELPEPPQEEPPEEEPPPDQDDTPPSDGGPPAPGGDGGSGGGGNNGGGGNSGNTGPGAGLVPQEPVPGGSGL